MSQKWMGIALSVVAAATLVVGVFHPTWVAGNDYGIESKVGLRSIVICQDVQPDPDVAPERACEPVDYETWKDSEFAPEGFGTFRILCLVAFFTGLAAALFLLVTAGLQLANKWVYWFIQPASLAILLSIIAGGAAVLALALNPFKGVGWGTGPGFLIMGGGATAGLLAGIMLGRIRPPVEDDLFEP